MKITLEIHDASKELPEESGTYLAFQDHGYPQYPMSAITLPYSARYRKFNVRDDYNTLENAIEVTFWCENPDIHGTLS